ncbi:MAG TPA: hypothetical protein VFT24_07720 [Vicinamibacterales bacterium]|nr:hypothetical protein [Vicinamibacterales bacterium]
MRLKPISAAICLGLVASQAACNLSSRKASRVDAISGILDAFRTHHIVALGEGIHGNNQAHAVRLALVRNPRFATIVNDIVVEFGSSKYQTVMDRFIRGDDVPYAELRKAWQDTTTQHAGWDLPIYEEFFRAVRDVNASLPGDRQVRVLLGDPPIDWSTVRTHEDVGRWLALRDHVVDVIKREVLPANRRALVLYGDGHLRRYSKWRGSAGPAHPTMLNRIEAEGTRAISIWTNTTVELERMQKDISSWPIPSLTMVRGTRLGALDFKYFAGMETDPPTTMEEQYDAVLYLGPVSSITFSELPAALCADDEYKRMRLARMALGPGGPNGPDVVEFNRQCARFLRQPQK